MRTRFLPLTLARATVRTSMALALGSALLACGQYPDDNDDTQLRPDESPIPVRVASVSQHNSDDSLRFAGISRAQQRATLTFQVGGVIESRAATIGQQVSAGDILAQLYNPQLEPSRDAARSRLEQLQADSAQARRDLTRIEQLYERGVSPLSDLEQQRARVQSLLAAVNNADATLQQSRGLLAENTMRAPFPGVIEAVLLEPGEFAQAGQPVIQLAASNGMEIEVRVPAHLLRDLRVGQTLPVWSSLSGTLTGGQVLEVGSSGSGTNTLFPLIVALAGDAVGAGDAFEVGIPRRTEPSLVIPVNAVMRSADGLTVFRFNPDNNSETGSISRVPVQISELLGDQAILEGNALSRGDAVVYAGLTRLADGDRVRVLP